SMTRPVALRDRARTRQLIERALLESDREGSHGLRALLSRERGEGSRVHAAGQQHSDRHVCDEVGAHGVAQACPALLPEPGLIGVVTRRERAWTREALKRARTCLPDEQVTGRKLSNLAEDRERGGNRVEREEGLERVEIELPSRQRVELGGERERHFVEA